MHNQVKYTIHWSLQSKKECKDKESMQSSATPDQGIYNGKWQKHIKHHKQESQEVSPFPGGDHKASMNRQESTKKSKHK